MDDEADAAREYDRLRAELADFVLAALAERIADGREPRLGQALINAIDRRVDEAVAARLAQAEWPDPDSFADSVIASAAGRGGEGLSRASDRPRRSEGKSGTRREPPAPTRRFTTVQIVLLSLIGVAIIAAATYFFLRGFNAAPPDTFIKNTQTNTFEQVLPADGNLIVQPPPGNAAAPTSAGAAQNVQGPDR